MKLKSFCITVFTILALVSTASSYALKVYIKNNSVHKAIYFSFPGGFSIGPVKAHQQIELSAMDANDLRMQKGKVCFAHTIGLINCGEIDFSKYSAVAVTVDIFHKCRVIGA